jgi:hypothetical protein
MLKLETRRREKYTSQFGDIYANGRYRDHKERRNGSEKARDSVGSGELIPSFSSSEHFDSIFIFHIG